MRIVALVATAGCYQGVSFEPGVGLGQDPMPDGSADSDSGPDEDVESLCGEPSPGASPIRRLTAWEYDNTISDLLGDDRKLSSGFPEEGGSGFDNNADVSVVSRLMANKYMLASELIAEQAVQDVDVLLGCTSGQAEHDCVSAWLTEFGRRAWRRPLTDSEHADLMEFFAAARGEDDLAMATSTLLQRILQSPNFLYRVELYDRDRDEAAVALDDWQIASRLSYLLWGSMPDVALFEAAAAGELRTLDQIEAQARRMLVHDKAREMLSHFHEQWLGYKRLETIDKDTAVFPRWRPEIADKQRIETNAFVHDVVLDGDAKLATLLTASYTILDAELAAFYGVPFPGGEAWLPVAPDERAVAGLLTQGGVMASHAKPDKTNPIARGLFIREQFLCTLPPPPPDVVELPPVDPNATAREKLEQHRADPACAACHALFDPIGLGFEQFDAVGAWRTEEHDQVIDASGRLTATDVDGAFDGPEELAERLARSEDVARCVARQWFRYAYGRVEHKKKDACNLDRIDEAFADSDYDLRELLIALTLTDGFRFRTANGGA